MSKNLKEAILENQKMNRINTNIMTASEKEAKKNAKSKKAKVATMLMAFAKGQESSETVEIKRYIGIASCNVLGVCPSKEELDKIYGRPSEGEPNYLNEFEVSEGNKVPQARIEFILKTTDKYKNDKGEDLNLILRKSFYVAKAYRFNRDHSKVQVIDKYGRTAWVTEAQLSTHEIPMYSNGLANLDKDYRPAYIGEENLTNFLISYLNIPGVMKYNQAEKKWYMVENPQDSEARLECIENYFKGDFSEVKGAISMQPNNKVKALIGVKSNNGKLYQDVYDMVVKNGINEYSKLEKDLNERKASGAYPNTEFKICELCEYTVESTNFGTTTAPIVENPFANPFDPNF